MSIPGQWRTEGGGFGGLNPRPEIPKALQNRAKLNPIVKTVKIAEFRTPTPQDVRKKGSKILKLPPVRSCFTLAMTSKLVLIINSLEVPKIKKSLLYEISCTKLQLPPEPLTRELPPPDPRSLCLMYSTEFVYPPRTKFLGTPLSLTNNSVTF